MSRARKGEAPATGIAEASSVTPVYHDKASNIMESTTTPTGMTTAPVPPEFGVDRIAVTFAEREESLVSCLRTADCYSSQGFGSIETLARLALLSLEHREGYVNTEDIAVTLRTIMNLAAETASEINSQASLVGCEYVDKASYRRVKALADYEAELDSVAGRHTAHG